MYKQSHIKMSIFNCKISFFCVFMAYFFSINYIQLSQNVREYERAFSKKGKEDVLYEMENFFNSSKKSLKKSAKPPITAETLKGLDVFLKKESKVQTQIKKQKSKQEFFSLKIGKQMENLQLSDIFLFRPLLPGVILEKCREKGFFKFNILGNEKWMDSYHFNFNVYTNYILGLGILEINFISHNSIFLFFLLIEKFLNTNAFIQVFDWYNQAKSLFLNFLGYKNKKNESSKINILKYNLLSRNLIVSKGNKKIYDLNCFSDIGAMASLIKDNKIFNFGLTYVNSKTLIQYFSTFFSVKTGFILGQKNKKENYSFLSFIIGWNHFGSLDQVRQYTAKTKDSDITFKNYFLSRRTKVPLVRTIFDHDTQYIASCSTNTWKNFLENKKKYEENNLFHQITQKAIQDDEISIDNDPYEAISNKYDENIWVPYFAIPRSFMGTSLNFRVNFPNLNFFVGVTCAFIFYHYTNLPFPTNKSAFSMENFQNGFSLLFSIPIQKKGYLILGIQNGSVLISMTASHNMYLELWQIASEKQENINVSSDGRQKMILYYNNV